MMPVQPSAWSSGTIASTLLASTTGVVTGAGTVAGTFLMVLFNLRLQAPAA